MPRRKRITFHGATYHITTRGNNKANVFNEDIDFYLFLKILRETIERFKWTCYAYCIMNNHYHLLVETPEDNISDGMRYLNSNYAKIINYHQKRSGHLFQGPFHSVIIDSDKQMLAVIRYIILNPVRAGMVPNAAQWKWSSYKDIVNSKDSTNWLHSYNVLKFFQTRQDDAIVQFKQYIENGVGLKSPFK